MEDYKSIIQALRRYRRRIVVARTANRLALVLTLFSIFSLVAFGAFAVFPWTLLPLAWVIVVAASALAIVGVVTFAVVRKPSFIEVAEAVDAQRPDKHVSIRIAFELGADEIVGTSRELRERAVAETVSALELFPRHLKGIHRRNRYYVAAVSIVAFAVSAVFMDPSLYSYRALPMTMFQSPTANLYPGRATVPRGAVLQLRCSPDDVVYPSARVSMRPLDERKTMRRFLSSSENGDFVFTTDPLTRSHEYWFSLGGVVFGPETIDVVEPPILKSIRLTVTPPRYTGRKIDTLKDGRGSLAAYAGTKVGFSLQSHFPLGKAEYVPVRGDTLGLSIVGAEASGEVTVWRPHSYSFSLSDTLGQRNDSLPEFFVDIIPDYPPSVRILRPGRNASLSVAMRETLWVEGSDDLGIREMELQWRVSTDDSLRRWDIAPPQRNKLVRRELVWELTDAGLYPGDTVFYWAMVRDSKPYGTPQRALSDTFWYRIPSFAEIHEDVVRKEDMAGRQLSAVHEQQGSMQEQLERFIRTAKGKEQLSWEEKKIMEDLQKNHENQVDSLQSAVEALQDAVSQMKEEGLLNEDVVRRMDEVKDAIQDLVEEYGDSVLFKPDEDNAEMSWSDVRDAVEKMQEMLPDLQERLESAMQYLDMLKQDRELAQLAARAENLSQQQARLAETSEKDRLRRERELLNEVGDLLEDVDNSMSEASRSEPESLEAVEENAKKMQQMVSDGSMPDVESMSRMSADLQSMSQQLNSMLSSAMATQMMKDREMLLGMAGDALDLAEWQEELQSTRSSSVGEAESQMTAAAQQAIKEALRKTVSQLDSLTSTPPALLQDIVREADQTESAMENALSGMRGNMPGQENRMSQAANGLKGLAGSFLSSANAMQNRCNSGSCSNPQGAGGLMPGLRKLSGKQAAVNAATGELLRQMMGGEGRPGSGNKPGEGGKAARQAAQNAQEGIAKQLRELADQYGGQSGDERLEERMKELEEEARRLARMLENPKEQVRERQDRFLVRLLQTTLSTRKQGEGKQERKSRTAETIYAEKNQDAPGAIVRDIDTFQRIRSRALEGNYPDDYRRTVQAYFDSLGVLFLKE